MEPPNGMASNQVGDDTGLTSELVDLSGIELFQLAELPDSLLTRALRRLFVECGEGSEPFAGFESHI
jgi:FXSXX-COOH protein